MASPGGPLRSSGRGPPSFFSMCTGKSNENKVGLVYQSHQVHPKANDTVVLVVVVVLNYRQYYYSLLCELQSVVLLTLRASLPLAVRGDTTSRPAVILSLRELHGTRHDVTADRQLLWQLCCSSSFELVMFSHTRQAERDRERITGLLCRGTSRRAIVYFSTSDREL